MVASSRALVMSEHIKKAQTEFPVLSPIPTRFSPYVFDGRPVEREKLMSCFEAARWAASSYNEQPWIFIVATREDSSEFAKMLDCLVEQNQVWAKNAGAIIATAVSKVFSRNGKPNRVAEHDLGQAAAHFSLQATVLGLQTHQMAGINPSRMRQAFLIPDSHEPLTAMAIGYVGVGSESDKELASRDAAPRSRKPFSEFVFQGQWGRPLA